MAGSLPPSFSDRDRAAEWIEEPPDEQVDAIEKIRFMPGVFDALRAAQAAGFKLVMVTNQDGLGSASLPQAAFDVPHQFMMDAFSSQGIEFDAVFVCPHRKSDGCDCRKPKIRLVEGYVREQNVDLAASARRPEIGERVSVIPNHICLVSNLFTHVHGVRGGVVEVVWPVAARGLLQ